MKCVNGPSELSDEEKTRKPRETNAAAKNERTKRTDGESLLHFFASGRSRRSLLDDFMIMASSAMFTEWLICTAIGRRSHLT